MTLRRSILYLTLPMHATCVCMSAESGCMCPIRCPKRLAPPSRSSPCMRPVCEAAAAGTPAPFSYAPPAGLRPAVPAEGPVQHEALEAAPEDRRAVAVHGEPLHLPKRQGMHGLHDRQACPSLAVARTASMQEHACAAMRTGHRGWACLRSTARPAVSGLGGPVPKPIRGPRTGSATGCPPRARGLAPAHMLSAHAGYCRNTETHRCRARGARAHVLRPASSRLRGPSPCLLPAPSLAFAVCFRVSPLLSRSTSLPLRLRARPSGRRSGAWVG